MRKIYATVIILILFQVIIVACGADVLTYQTIIDTEENTGGASSSLTDDVEYHETGGRPRNRYSNKRITFYEDGTVEDEFYFDDEGKPVLISFGYYGRHIEYDESGRASCITYLDKDGSPIITKQGFTTVKRTFYPDGSIETEMYYDLYGEQVALSHGQYGIKYVNGKKIYIDKNGNEFFELNNWLHNNQMAVVAIGIIIVVFSLTLNRRWNSFILVFYITFIIYMTLLYRSGGEPKIEIQLFWSYRQFFSSSSLRLEILNNIWLFIPLGVIACVILPSAWVVLIPVFISVVIETIQYFTGTGFAEVDDVISNGLGGLVGYAIWRLVSASAIRKTVAWK